jgi:hypothetical protein
VTVFLHDYAKKNTTIAKDNIAHPFRFAANGEPPSNVIKEMIQFNGLNVKDIVTSTNQLVCSLVDCIAH